MCGTCGCDNEDGVRIAGPIAAPDQDPHPHPHQPEHQHPHPTPRRQSRSVSLEQSILAKNDRLAEQNRRWLAARGGVAVNLMSSPGSGKTTLLERTIRALSNTLPVCVVEGDQETLIDAQRIRATGCQVVQINTGAGCHLDAAMLAEGLRRLDPPFGALVLVENVGNLVCPALFDLGERTRTVVASVTEGVDKPLKYPHMFRSADLVVLNKIDLLPYVDFDVDRFGEHARMVNPGARILRTSATRGDGLDSWTAWLRAQVDQAATGCGPSTP